MWVCPPTRRAGRWPSRAASSASSGVVAAAEEGAPAVERHGEGRREGTDVVEVGGGEAVAAPAGQRGDRGAGLRVRVGGRRGEEPGVGIAEDDWAGEIAQAGQRRGWARTEDGDIAETDQAVEAFVGERCEDGVEREEVAMDIRDQADAHTL